MNIKNKNRWLYAALFWIGLYVLWVAVFQSSTLKLTRTAGIQFCYLVFVAVSFYFIVYFIMPRLLKSKKYFLYTGIGLLFIAFTSLLRAEVAVFINTYFYNTPIASINFASLYFNSLLNIFIWTLCLVAGKIIADRIHHERQSLLIEKEKIKNELTFLRAQNNPHFLFNSLNSIYFQIDKSNPAARETLMRLSEILRYQLYECAVEKIPIDKEIDFLKNYIELQKLRLNDNYRIEFTVQHEVSGFLVAPLLIMPLIENAFKYVSHFTDKHNVIKINISMNAHQLTCDIYNTIESITIVKTSNGGIGLKNLERRLELLYPNKHELDYNNNGANYTVHLALDTNEN